jgi:hypothetical protein
MPTGAYLPLLRLPRSEGFFEQLRQAVIAAERAEEEDRIGTDRLLTGLDLQDGIVQGPRDTLTGGVIPPLPGERRRSAGKGSIQEIDDNGPFGRTGQHNLIPNAVRWLVGAGNRTLEDTSRDVERFVRDDPTMTDEERRNLVGSVGFGGTVIGRVGAANLHARGRPGAQRAIRQAMRLERQGMSMEEIRRRTDRLIERDDPDLLGSVVRLPDGQWGVELSNHLARFDEPPLPDLSPFLENPPRLPPSLRGEPTPLPRVLDDPNLLAAYPHLRTAHVMADLSVPYSSAFPAGTLPRVNVPLIRYGATPPREGRRVMLHETEHLAQSIEGFPRGSGPPMFEPGGPLAHLRRPNETAEQAYLRTAGEWLARQAEERQYMTGPERRRHPINPLDDLIIHYTDVFRRPRP